MFECMVNDLSCLMLFCALYIDAVTCLYELFTYHFIYWGTHMHGKIIICTTAMCSVNKDASLKLRLKLHKCPNEECIFMSDYGSHVWALKITICTCCGVFSNASICTVNQHLDQLYRHSLHSSCCFMMTNTYKTPSIRYDVDRYIWQDINYFSHLFESGNLMSHIQGSLSGGTYKVLCLHTSFRCYRLSCCQPLHWKTSKGSIFR